MPIEKAPKAAKSRKAPASKKTTEAAAIPAPAPAAQPAVIHRPTHDQIAALAYKYWAERGYTHGNNENDWLRAERELLKNAS